MEKNNQEGEKIYLGHEYEFSENISLFPIDITDIVCIDMVIFKLHQLREKFGKGSFEDRLNEERNSQHERFQGG
jgi:hypothetical protein